jgi:hypothetical protein
MWIRNNRIFPLKHFFAAFLVCLSIAGVDVTKVCDHGHNVDACFLPVIKATNKIEEEGVISATDEEVKAIERVCKYAMPVEIQLSYII